MKFVLFCIIFVCNTSYADTLKDMANRNGFSPSEQVIKAIRNAALLYNVNGEDLMGIAILETGVGRYSTVRNNKNGTQDIGVFQINSVNLSYCKEFNLKDVAGNALCAAKLLHRIKRVHYKDTKAVARYHSNTPKYKELYFNQLMALR